MHKLEFKTSNKTFVGIKYFALPDYVFPPSFYTKKICESLNLEEAEKEGEVIDLGTGSGVIAITLCKMGCKNVYASDCFERTLEVAKRNFELNEIKVSELILSDMFKNISKELRFDLIITNPPAFPMHKNLHKNEELDNAIFSGKDGRNFTFSFLDSVGDHLKEKGRFLIAVPEFLDWSLVEAQFKLKGLHYRCLIEEETFLPTYGYPQLLFIENFKSVFKSEFYKSKTSPFYFCPDDEKIHFKLKIYEGRKG